jgi:hypothetical protein
MGGDTSDSSAASSYGPVLKPRANSYDSDDESAVPAQELKAKKKRMTQQGKKIKGKSSLSANPSIGKDSRAQKSKGGMPPGKKPFGKQTTSKLSTTHGSSSERGSSSDEDPMDEDSSSEEPSSEEEDSDAPTSQSSELTVKPNMEDTKTRRRKGILKPSKSFHTRNDGNTGRSRSRPSPIEPSLPYPPAAQQNQGYPHSACGYAQTTGQPPSSPYVTTPPGYPSGFSTTGSVPPPGYPYIQPQSPIYYSPYGQQPMYYPPPAGYPGYPQGPHTPTLGQHTSPSVAPGFTPADPRMAAIQAHYNAAATRGAPGFTPQSQSANAFPVNASTNATAQDQNTNAAASNKSSNTKAKPAVMSNAPQSDAESSQSTASSNADSSAFMADAQSSHYPKGRDEVKIDERLSQRAVIEELRSLQKEINRLTQLTGQEKAAAAAAMSSKDGISSFSKAAEAPFENQAFSSPAEVASSKKKIG